MQSTKYQTLGEFISRPFGKKPPVDKTTIMNTTYKTMLASKKLKLNAITVLEKSYYYHINVPSESGKSDNYKYDVVIRFFTDDPLLLKENTLENYHIQFYSNSPSFMYKYAYLYNKEGYLVADLYGKTDTDFIRVPPTKRNSNMDLMWDKSIYCACMYLFENRHRLLHKRGPATLKMKTKNSFFRGIADFNAVKFDQALMSEEKRLSKSLDKSANAQHIAQDNVTKKIQASKSTLTNKSSKSSINIKRKITPSGRVSKKNKIRAKRGT